MPYAGKPDIQHNPSMGATPSYIHTGNSAYGSKLPALGGTTKVINNFATPKKLTKIHKKIWPQPQHDARKRYYRIQLKPYIVIKLEI